MRVSIIIDEDDLIADVNSGMFQREIAKKYDCSSSVIFGRVKKLKEEGKLPKTQPRRTGNNQYNTPSFRPPNFKEFDLRVGDKLKISKEMWAVDWISERVFGVSNGRKRESFQKKEYSIGLMEVRE